MDPIITVALIAGASSAISAHIQARSTKRKVEDVAAIVGGNGHGNVTQMVEYLRENVAIVKERSDEQTALLHEIVGELRVHVADDRAHRGRPR